MNTLLYNVYFIILLLRAHCSSCCQLQNIFPRNSLLYNILYICAEVYLDKVLLRPYLSIYYEIVSFSISNRQECADYMVFFLNFRK